MGHEMKSSSPPFKKQKTANFSPRSEETAGKSNIDLHIQSIGGNVPPIDDKRIRNALKAGVIDESQYDQGKPGVYVITTKEGTEQHGMHGELKVTEAIYKRRKKIADARENNDFTGENVYIGGALVDCIECNAHHAGMNAKIEQEGYGYRFYSSGTHGQAFPSWKPSATSKKDSTVDRVFTTIMGYCMQYADLIDKNPSKDVFFHEDSDSEPDIL